MYLNVLALRCPGAVQGAFRSFLTAHEKGLKSLNNKDLRPEAPAGFEPAMADLQSAALATWPRRLNTMRLGKQP